MAGLSLIKVGFHAAALPRTPRVISNAQPNKKKKRNWRKQNEEDAIVEEKNHGTEKAAA